MPLTRSLPLLVGVISCVFASACRPAEEPPDSVEEIKDLDHVRWGLARDSRPVEELTEEQREAIANVESLGYIDGIQPPPDAEGVTAYSPEHAQPGLNFFVSSHSTYAALMDMEGNILHEWSSDFDTAFPDYPHNHDDNRNENYWRRAFVLPGGRLVAIHEGMGMVCLDRDSHVLWSQPNKAHHDLDFQEDGRIVALTREGQFHPRFGLDGPVVLDYVDFLSPEGERLHRISIDQAYLDSKFEAPVKFRHPKKHVYHTNTLEILDGRLAERIPAFARGNVLLSFRTHDQLAVLDVETEKIAWVREGIWVQQHQPTVLENGNLLLFDNKGGDPAGGKARVLELDPVTLETVWMYDGTPEHPLDCEFLGTSSRLPNGNTLIVESLFGRVIEVTPEGAIAWEYINPRRAGDNDEYIAVIPEMIRIDPESVEDWLDLPAGLRSGASMKPEAYGEAPAP